MHRIAHPRPAANCTMLYGHIETLEERVDHLLQLRDLQDETGGFQTFIPLGFHNENNRWKPPEPTAFDDLRTFAVSRLMLDNIPHIKAYWIMLGLETAQTALRSAPTTSTAPSRRSASTTWPARTRRRAGPGRAAARDPQRRTGPRSSATPCTTSSRRGTRWSRANRTGGRCNGPWRCCREKAAPGRISAAGRGTGWTLSARAVGCSLAVKKSLAAKPQAPEKQ